MWRSLLKVTRFHWEETIADFPIKQISQWAFQEIFCSAVRNSKSSPLAECGFVYIWICKTVMLNLTDSLIFFHLMSHAELDWLLDFFPPDVQVQVLGVCGHGWAKISHNRPLAFLNTWQMRNTGSCIYLSNDIFSEKYNILSTLMWGHKLLQLLWKAIWQYILNALKHSYPAILFLGAYCLFLKKKNLSLWEISNQYKNGRK